MAVVGGATRHPSREVGVDRVHGMLSLVDTLAALGDAECKWDIHYHDRAVLALELTTECRLED